MAGCISSELNRATTALLCKWLPQRSKLPGYAFVQPVGGISIYIDVSWYFADRRIKRKKKKRKRKRRRRRRLSLCETQTAGRKSASVHAASRCHKYAGTNDAVENEHREASRAPTCYCRRDASRGRMPACTTRRRTRRAGEASQ